MDFLYVLHLPAYPRAIDYRAYAQGNRGFALLDWFLPRLVKRLRTDSLLILCHDARDRELAGACAREAGIPVFESPLNSKLEALADLAAAFPGRDLVCFRVELAFAPTDLLNRVCHHHVECENQYTSVIGLPSEVTPEVFNGGLLVALGRVPYVGDPPDPSRAVQELIARRASGAGRTEIRAQPFRHTHAGTPAEDLPSELSVLTLADTERARQCLDGLPQEYDFQALRAWNSATSDVDMPSFSATASRVSRRLLYLSVWSAYSGAEENLRSLVQAMNAHEFSQFAVVGMEGLLSRRLRQANCNVICTNWDFTQEDENSRRFADHVLDSLRPMIVHCNCDPGPHFFTAAEQRRIPVAVHMQSVEFPPSLNWLWRATRVIAVSEYVKCKLAAAGLPADRISVVYNGVDTQKFQPRAAERRTLRTQFGLPPDAFLVLMVARLTVQKRHDLALEAAAEALSRVPNLHLVFVAPFGFPELRGILNARIHSLGLGGKVTWLPFQEDIRQIESAADVLILPSDHEASGICVIEAMAVQVPVVVSDSGGSHELVEHEVSGLVVPGGDAAALADSLARLALDPELAANLVRNGRRRVENLFSLERYANAVAAVLRPLSDHALQ